MSILVGSFWVILIIIIASRLLSALIYYLLYKIMGMYIISTLLPVFMSLYVTFKIDGYNLFIKILFWLFNILVLAIILLLNIGRRMELPKIFLKDNRRRYMISYSMLNGIYILGLLKNLIPDYSEININWAVGILCIILFLITLFFCGLSESEIPES